MEWCTFSDVYTGTRKACESTPTAFYMVGMVVSNEHGVNFSQLDAIVGAMFLEGTNAYAKVDDYAVSVAVQIIAVSAASG